MLIFEKERSQVNHNFLLKKLQKKEQIDMKIIPQ